MIISSLKKSQLVTEVRLDPPINKYKYYFNANFKKATNPDTYSIDH
jgi:hypothetical protein